MTLKFVMLSEAKHLSTRRLAAERSVGHRKGGGLRMTCSLPFDPLSSNQEK
jgi:hypothetical protein